MSREFIHTCLSLVEPGESVLDLGAGNGIQAKLFADRGAVVTAVDTALPKDRQGSIRWHQVKIEDFLLTDKSGYDLIFARNVIQFLDKEWFVTKGMPRLEERMNKGGYLAIQTFYKNPEPSFPVVSLYSAEELASHFQNMRILMSEQTEHVGPDLNGSNRKFYISSLIIQKSPA